ncbi:UDP-N-acetylglucosamine 2-epimerase [Algoriphagus sp.]|uniref:UDP-N-acetylglucosamine 2-epimerase n=1 Tax=Algoriphagus sp. TaxID=1872435 RepID=UPI00271E362B|nr:UDP-N-acetylglucosamine 2-epimerase [Algoriphagus sp.]MDO8967475.1 UDP-N-acetylglucosamine 2-epimerase [Algoriphagus sp.]MDP3201785.1 UDP-N-acetylglucosamine 2-epimerase [Algoriphagus sp.]
MTKKKILFLSGTRADFGKLKSLIRICVDSSLFEVHIFATGMHLQGRYGMTVKEIEKSGFENIFRFINYTSETTMDLTLSKTIDGLSSFIKENQPDLIIVHGDRVEALAGAIVGALNNILVGHIEGGEVSGTIDELIRHSVSKLSHFHFVANDLAKRRLIQMGEVENQIFVIGSPDVDIMFSNDLPSLERAKSYYQVPFEKYAVLMFHPITTEFEKIGNIIETLVDVILADNSNYLVIYPNNDLGSSRILEEYARLDGNERIKIYPSLRFEYFLTFLKNSEFLIGNSSAGIREAPYYGLPSVNIGTRQNNRAESPSIIHTSYSYESIKEGISKAKLNPVGMVQMTFGDGSSDEKFLSILKEEPLWDTSLQKLFKDI